MNVLLAAGIVVVLLVVAGATVMTYYALWKIWQSIPPTQRRKHLAWQIGGFLISAGILALLITAPLGVYPHRPICVRHALSRGDRMRSDRRSCGSCPGCPPQPAA